MKIADLLNGPTPRRHADKRLDMASLDLFTQKRKHRPELSMSRIIQELAIKEGLTRLESPPPTVSVNPTSPKAEYETKVVEIKPKQPKVKAKTKVKTNKEEKNESPNSEETKPTRRRRARNGFAPLTESEKRVKQRMLVKRSYYRKIDTLVGLRNEMEELETKCKEVIISRPPLQSTSQIEEEERRYEELRERYTQLAITQDDLRHENEKLRAEAMEQSKARSRIGILLNEELHEQKEARTKGESLGLSPWSSEVVNQTEDSSENSKVSCSQESKPVLDFVPISEDECIRIVREAYADVRSFADKQHYESTGASVFGWRDRRQVDGDTMRFFLEKTFENYTAAETSSRMWDLVSSEQGVNRIYASDVAINFHLVQRVNDENVLFHRTIEPQGVHMVLKTLILASRVQIDDNGSFMVLFRSVDPEARGIVKKDTTSSSAFSTEKTEVWSDAFSWGLYEAAGDRGQHCRNYFGGFVSSLVTERSLEFWLMHILLIAVRCENEVIGPLFIMQ
ncbi:hypothetical protein PR003_g20696 [Phytophthora rubi]|uniref:Uncharacterized protein n=1 Tax=Phytophthora rubi TaxID=129364 RepID=A0A6A3JIT9_9STRA|nr:hypothetical protein PR001_g20954 [Phytophthora rubi]KAE8995053.1 hypothetical protein PR002_g19740 [Phytophthora rubi]KAE9308640.1 hypothetical protein PR003_g20696 [Phytophthora rubi]